MRGEYDYLTNKYIIKNYMKKISIIIPMFNSEKFIKHCLDSIISKENENDIEILVIDDNSSDSSRQIVENYKKDCIKLFHNITNKGVSYSRNLGILNASGKYIMFVDADDYLINGWYTEVTKYIGKGNEDIIYFGKKHKDCNMNKKDIILSTIGISNNAIGYAAVWSKLYYKKYIIDNKIKFYEEIINGEDMLFNMECLSKTNKILFINKSIYNYRITNESSTKKFNEKIINSDVIFHEKIKNILKSYIEIFNECELKNISSFCYNNNIYAIGNRLSYCKNYHIFKKYIKQYDIDIRELKNIEGIKKIIIYIIHYKMYYIAYMFFSLKTKINKKRKTIIIEI